jgi:hypothetical protein
MGRAFQCEICGYCRPGYPETEETINYKGVEFRVSVRKRDESAELCNQCVQNVLKMAVEESKKREGVR